MLLLRSILDVEDKMNAIWFGSREFTLPSFCHSIFRLMSHHVAFTFLPGILYAILQILFSSELEE